MKAEGKIGDIIYLAHVNDIILNIQNGRADFTINDLPVTQAYMSQNPGVIKIVDYEITSDAYGFAVKTGNTELLTMLTGSENVKKNGTYDQKWINISKKHLSGMQQMLHVMVLSNPRWLSIYLSSLHRYVYI